jgi:hypothetical protein
VTFVFIEDYPAQHSRAALFYVLMRIGVKGLKYLASSEPATVNAEDRAGHDVGVRRTVQEDGNSGTDHGHGNVMMVVGGSVNGGHVYGRWPGLEPEQLYEGRDLAVTTDFRDVLGELVSQHLGQQIDHVFPGDNRVAADRQECNGTRSDVERAAAGHGRRSFGPWHMPCLRVFRLQV